MSLSYDIPKDEIRAGRFVLDGEVWVKERTCRNDDTDDDDFFTCSACKSSSITEFLRGGYGVPNYCPTCGAKVVSE